MDHPDWKAPHIYHVKSGGQMKEYTVPNPHGDEMTILLSDEDAKAQGLASTKKAEPEATKEAAAPANKARAASTVKDK